MPSPSNKVPASPVELAQIAATLLQEDNDHLYSEHMHGRHKLADMAIELAIYLVATAASRIED